MVFSGGDRHMHKSWKLLGDMINDIDIFKLRTLVVQKRIEQRMWKVEENQQHLCWDLKSGGAVIAKKQTF